MFKTSLVQFDTIYKDPEANREKIKRALEKAVNGTEREAAAETAEAAIEEKGKVVAIEKGKAAINESEKESASGPVKDISSDLKCDRNKWKRPDLIVFPETCTSGYSAEVFGEIERYAEEECGKTLTMFRELAKEYRVCICTGSLPESAADGIFNTVYLIGRDGAILGKYRKMHLYSAMDEDKAFGHGVEMPVFDTEFGKIAMMTCYDIRFVELSRTYAVRGAQAIVVVSNFPNPKVNHWRTLLQARAIENQLYIIACNRVGAAGESTYFGHSLIIDPWGEIVAEGGDVENIIEGNVDFCRIEQVRSTIPMYKDRRPSSYPGDILEENNVCRS